MKELIVYNYNNTERILRHTEEEIVLYAKRILMYKSDSNNITVSNALHEKLMYNYDELKKIRPEYLI